MNIEVRELADLGTDARRAFFERDAGVGEVQSDVRDIVERVRREGDVAVREFSNEFDGVQVGNIDVTDAAKADETFSMLTCLVSKHRKQHNDTPI